MTLSKKSCHISLLQKYALIQKKNLILLKWWQDNKHFYPNVAKFVQMWLSAPATSTPSECVFSICSVVDTAKRNRLDGKSIGNHVTICTD